MWLLGIAILGFAVGNGLFVYWLLNDYQGLAAIWSDHLALAFIVDALLTLIVLTVHFARQPQGACGGPGSSCCPRSGASASGCRSTGGSTDGRRRGARSRDARARPPLDAP